MEPKVIMAQLFELEREELYEEARQRCLAYAEKYPDTPASSLLTLRAATYLETMGKTEEAIKIYQSMEGAGRSTETEKQASRLAWFHKDRHHLLVSANVNGKYEIFLDGRPAGRGDNPRGVSVLRPGSNQANIS